MKKDNIRKLLAVKYELRYNEKMTELLDDIIVDECGEDERASRLLEKIFDTKEGDNE